MSSFIKKDNVLIYSYSYIYQDSIGSNLIIIFKDPVVFKEVTRIHNFHVAVNTVLLRLSDQIKSNNSPDNHTYTRTTLSTDQIIHNPQSVLESLDITIDLTCSSFSFQNYKFHTFINSLKIPKG